ncbi:hypothetical protein Tco_0509989, partial [Tanacetum coccineum]
MVVRKRRLWLLKIQTQKPWWQQTVYQCFIKEYRSYKWYQSNNEDIDWTKEFDAEPVTYAMMALTGV